MTLQAQECGMTFVKEYYNHLATDPQAPALTNMYTKFSQMITEDGEVVSGVEKISDVLAKKALEQRKFRLYGVGCYPSAYESILVLVRGVVLTRESTKNFNQTFLLVPVKGFADAPENTFYVYNDVLELTEDVDLSPVPVATPQEQPAVPEEVEPEQTYEEPEPEPEPVVEEPVQEEVEEPAQPEVVEEKAAPPAKAEPAPVREPAPVASGWAGILGRRSNQKAEAEAPSAKPQVVAGGSIPNRTAAKPKDVERARGTSPTRRGPRGSSPPKFNKTFSIYVRLSGYKKEDITEADIEGLFAKFGKIVSKTLNVEKGYCFVDFAEKKGADLALAASEANEISHGGKALECSSRSGEKKPAPKGAGDKPRGLTNGTSAAQTRRK